MEKSFDGLSTEMGKLVVSGYDRLERYVADRWAVFEKDASEQLARALTVLELAAIEELETALVKTRTRLEGVGEQIRWTPNPR